MTTNSLPQMPVHLEQTYRALLKFRHGTYRDVMTELGLKSPAPLMCRIKKLVKLGVIQVK